MEDELVHEDAQEFEDFVETELKGLAARAQEAGICLDCLSDRLLVELVAGTCPFGRIGCGYPQHGRRWTGRGGGRASRRKSRRSHRMH
jgi:hypothetical protein